MTQTDIEIYIKAATPEAIQEWLSLITLSLDAKSFSPKRQAYWATMQSLDETIDEASKEFEIIVLSSVQNNYSSIWFNSAKTPWANDKACAKQAFDHFKSAVRCTASGWQEGDQPDQWLHIDDSGEEVIDWI